MNDGELTAAFERTVLEYEKSVYNYALSILCHREDAEDAVQETFLRLWRAYERGADISAAYVFRTARSCAIDIARRKRRRQTVLQTVLKTDSLTDADGFDAELPDTDPDSQPREYFERRRKCRAVWSAINSMPLADREVLVMRDINGLAYSEIAAALRLPVGTVKSRISRARERLAALLEDERP